MQGAAGSGSERPDDDTTHQVRGAIQGAGAFLQRLPDEDREVLVLGGIEQLPFKAVAEKLGVNIGTLRWRYHGAGGTASTSRGAC